MCTWADNETRCHEIPLYRTAGDRFMLYLIGGKQAYAVFVTATVIASWSFPKNNINNRRQTSEKKIRRCGDQNLFLLCLS